MPGLGTNKKANVIRTNGGTQAKPKGGTVGQQQWLGGGNQWAPKGNGPQPKQGLGAAPQPGAAPPAAPAAPAATLPWDSQFQLASGAAERNYGNKLAYLASKKLLTQQEFGLDPQFADAATNPYSKAALLKQSYQNAQKAIYNSAGNQLYAGSTVNKRTGAENNYNQGYDTLNREYLANLGSIGQEEAEALEARENAISEAGWRRLEAAQNQPLEPVPAASGTNAAAATVKVKGKKKKIAVGNARKA